MEWMLNSSTLADDAAKQGAAKDECPILHQIIGLTV
jgi:hypothetical protein